MRPPRRIRRGTLFLSWFGRLCVFLVPLAWLAYSGISSFLGHANYYLARSAPLVSQEVSRSLQRAVTVRRLTPNLSVQSLWAMVRHPEAVGTLPVEADDIVVGTHVTRYADKVKGSVVFDEPRLSGSPVFARARRATAYVSLPALLSGSFVTALTRVEIVDPWIVIVRDPNGAFNVTQLVPPRPPSKPSPPIRTIIEVTNGTVRYRDWHSPWPNDVRTTPMQDELGGVAGTADLSGARIYRFVVAARAAAGTPTVGHLGGMLHLSAVLGRGEVGLRPDSPSPATARYIIHFRAEQGNVPYWLYNYLTVGLADPRTPGPHHDSFRINRGVADVDLTVAAPRPDVKGGPIPGVGFTIAARFAQGDIESALLPVPLRGGAGDFRYNDGTLAFNARGSVLDRPVMASGALWNLTAESPGKPVLPELSVTVHAPSAPVTRLARLFVPHLPPGVRVGGDASVDGLITGSFKDLVAIGSFSRAAASYAGLPAARDISARFTYAGGRISLTDLKAALDGGGSATGHVAARLFRTPPGDKSGGTPGDAEFALHATNVDLASVTALRGLSKTANRNLRLVGRGDVETVGRRLGGTLTAAANVSTHGLRVGDLPFSVARARVLVRQDPARTTFAVPAARIESPAGAITAAGDIAPTGALALRWAASSLDLSALGRAAGFSGARGLVSASGTVDGTLTNPRAQIADLAGNNLRLQLPATDSGREERRFAADTLVGHGIVVTSRGIALPKPIVIRRFPAVAFVTGSVTGLFAGNAPAKPRLNLSASVSNLDFSEIERQTALRVTVPPGVTSAMASAARGPLTADAVAARRAPGALTGFITRASLTARGPIADPRIAGRAALGHIVIGSYPVDAGSVDFAYDRTGGARLSNITLAASAGTVTASLGLLPSGTLSGRFAAPALDAEKLSFLTQNVASLGGKVAISGVVSGSSDAPVVTAQIAPSNVTVAGIPLTDLTAHNIRVAIGLNGKTSRIEAAHLSFRQVQSPPPGAPAGSAAKETAIRIDNAFYETATGRFAADITGSSDDVGGLISTLSGSALRDTAPGRAFVASLDALPIPIAGKVSIDRLNVGGQIASRRNEEGKLAYRLVDGTGDAVVTGSGIRVGSFSAPTVEARATLRGSKITAERIVAASTATTVRANGSYDTDTGAIHAVVETNEASIDSFRSFAGLQALPLRGKVDVSIQVEGTAAAPNITASLAGANIDVVPLSDNVTAATKALFTLSVLRATGQYVADETGRGTITLSDVLVERGKSLFRLEGKIPVSTRVNDPALADRAITLTASAPNIDLAEFASLFGPAQTDKKGAAGTPVDLGGIVTAQVALTGTLRQPTLSGNMKVNGAHLTLPRAPGVSRAVINPIADLSGSLSLSGQTVTVDKMGLVLGGPSGLKGDFGRVDLGGTATVGSLAVLQRLLTRRAADETQATVPALGVSNNALNLTATFKGFRPVEDNLFGYGEAVSGVINGTLNIKGAPEAPVLKAPNEAPIHVADALLRLSANVPAQKATNTPPVITPTFDIPVVIDGKAVVADQNQTFRFEANGSANIGGRFGATDASGGAGAGDLDVHADLNVVGGYYQFPLARFTVQRTGSINLRYGAQRSGVSVTNVTARTKVYTKSGATISLASRISEGGSAVASTYRPTGTASTGYDITVTINGPLLLLEGENSGRGARETDVQFSSNPPLTKDQIVALLGNEDQLKMALNNNVNGAVTSLVTQSIYSSYIPRALAPLTQGVQSLLGLDEFSLDYDPTGYFSTVHLSKRLPGGLDRFMVELTQNVQTRSGQSGTGTQPFLYSLSYELFQFKPTSRIQPQMRLGVSDDEQHTITYFLRGSVAY